MEENLLMLEIGSHSIRKMKQEMTVLSKDDRETIQKEIESVYQEKMIVLRTLSNQDKETVQKMTDEMIQLKSDMKTNEWVLKHQLERDFLNQLQEEKEKAREKMEESLHNMREQFQRLKEEKIKIEEEKKYRERNMENELAIHLRSQQEKFNEKIEGLMARIDELKEESLEKEKKYVSLREKNRDEACDILKRTIEEKNVIIEEIKKTSSSKKLGEIGEQIFEDLANTTFGDFDDFRIEKTTGKAHSADFHLHFKNMVILVDAKKYSAKINSKTNNISKIKSELKLYPYIRIAWVVSLDTDIINLNTIHHSNNIHFTPVIEDDVCIIYVNSLMMSDDPSKILKTVWYISTLLYEHLMNNNEKTDELELIKYKKNEVRIRGIVEFIQNILREHTITLDKCKEHIATAKQKLKEVVGQEMKHMLLDDTDTVREWWENTIEPCPDGKLQSLVLYRQFVSEKKEEDMEKRMTHDKFKTILTTNNWIEKENLKQKNKKSQLEIVHYRLKIPNLQVIVPS